MINASNVGVLSGGLVSDPEVITTKTDTKIIKFSMGVNFAGSQGGKSTTGYFDVTYFASPGSPNSEFVNRQLEEGKLHKGSQINIVYRLNQDRWSQDGQNRSKVTLIAESIDYARSERSSNTSDQGNDTVQSVDPLPSRW